MGFAYFFYRTSDGSLPDFKQELITSNEEVVEELKLADDPEDKFVSKCDVYYADPVLPSEGEVQTTPFISLFDVGKGIMTRRLIDGVVHVGLEATDLDMGNKYVLHTLDVDENDNVCYSSVMGELLYSDDSKTFVSGIYKMEKGYVNDATVFAITKDVFGLAGHELSSLKDPNIVMIASFLSD